jgi:hypothetical protein
MPPAGGGIDVQESIVHAPSPTFTPPSTTHAAAVRSSHSGPPSSGRQHWTSPPAGGTTATHGFGSQDVPSTITPPSAAHSADVRSSHSGPLSSGMQQTTSPPAGGATPAHGSGRHEVAVDTVPPSAAHSSGVRSSHWAPASSGTQQITSPSSDCRSARRTASTSSPMAFRTLTRAPRGSNPKSSSRLLRGRLRNLILPPPAPLVVIWPTCTSSTRTS